MLRSENYRDFTIGWQEPPATGAGWVANVASERRDLQALIGSSAKVIDGHNRDDMLSNARAFVDSLLDHRRFW